MVTIKNVLDDFYHPESEGLHPIIDRVYLLRIGLKEYKTESLESVYTFYVIDGNGKFVSSSSFKRETYYEKGSVLNHTRMGNFAFFPSDNKSDNPSDKITDAIVFQTKNVFAKNEKQEDSSIEDLLAKVNFKTISVYGPPLDIYKVDNAGRIVLANFLRPNVKYGDEKNIHDFDERVLILSGKGIFSVGNINYICNPGTVVDIPAGESHSLRTGKMNVYALSIQARSL